MIHKYLDKAGRLKSMRFFCFFCLRSPGNIQCPRGACACQLVEKGQHEQLVIWDLLPIKTHHARPIGCHSLPATGAEPQCKATSASSESSKKALSLASEIGSRIHTIPSNTDP